MPDWTLTFVEPPGIEVSRALDRLLLTGEVASEAATAADLARARVPDTAGPHFLQLAKAHRALVLRDVDVRILLHDGSAAEDALGGWRLRTEPEEIDLRICVCPNPDWVVDATRGPWTADDPAVHSSFSHFLVRAVRGERL